MTVTYLMLLAELTLSVNLSFPLSLFVVSLHEFFIK